MLLTNLLGREVQFQTGKENETACGEVVALYVRDGEMILLIRRLGTGAMVERAATDPNLCVHSP